MLELPTDWAWEAIFVDSAGKALDSRDSTRPDGSKDAYKTAKTATAIVSSTTTVL